MYIRKVIKKSAHKEREVFRLVESYRTVNGPRQRTILTLKNFEVPKKKWKTLADAIEAKLNGQLVLYLEKELEFLAEYFHSEIYKVLGLKNRPLSKIITKY